MSLQGNTTAASRTTTTVDLIHTDSHTLDLAVRACSIEVVGHGMGSHVMPREPYAATFSLNVYSSWSSLSSSALSTSPSCPQALPNIMLPGDWFVSSDTDRLLFGNTCSRRFTRSAHERETGCRGGGGGANEKNVRVVARQEKGGRGHAKMQLGHRPCICAG